MQHHSPLRLLLAFALLLGFSTVASADVCDERASSVATTIDYTIDKDHGNLYNTNGSVNQTWNATWKSNSKEPELKFVAYDNALTETNNMTWSGTTLQIESGKRPPCTYTIAAPEGYVIDAYAFDFTANTTTTNTLTIGGTAYTTSQTAKHIAATEVDSRSVSFTLNGPNTTGTLLTNFVVKLRKLGVDEPDPDALFTTASEMAAGAFHWVRISNVRDAYSINAGTDTALHSQSTDFTNEGELFAFVGTEQSFRIYSRTAQAYYGYSAPSDGNAVTKGAPTQTFKLVNNTSNTKPGFNIVPTGNEGQSLNMHGGKGHDIKFYTCSDPGSTWKLTLIKAEVEGGVRIAGVLPPTPNRLLGKVTVAAGSATAETLLTLDDVTARGKMTYYVGADDRLSITPGYTFRGYKPSVDGMVVTYTVDEESGVRYLFYSTGAEHPYRIPAITRTRSGRLIALSDYRTCGSDIGYGRVDIVGRTSDDNGRTWSEQKMVLEGDGNDSSNTCGYGDAALVADCESDEVMLMCVSAPNGGTCWTSRQRGVVTVSPDGGQTWPTPVDIKDQICNKSGSLLPGVINYFVGSGKLHQSRYIKVGTHYRVYAALWTTSNGSSCNNHVVYTDDFGKTWKLLGTTSTCVAGGNEPKCEELPDGSVIISSRKGNGRYYNVFTYDKTDNADFSKGSWGSRVEGCNSGDSSTNGEILITKATNRDGQLVTIALQSMPNNARNKVSIWYRELNGASGHKFTSSEFSGAWTKGLEVSTTSSAYSTMCMQDDGRIAFYFEEGPASYEMVYMPLTISEATGGVYGPDVWSIGQETKAVKMANDGSCTQREINEIGRYILHPAK